MLRALVEAGARGLSEGALLDAVWGEDPPATGTKALQVVISRVRALTDATVVERTATGYRIGIDPDEVDLWAARPHGLALAAEGRYADALGFLDLAGDDEEVVLARLRAVAAVRGVPAALEAYAEHRAHLGASLGVDPGPALQRLHEELLHRDRPVRSGLAYDTDELIGRDRDVTAVTALLRRHRVVSIVGPGGLGKTRLAHRVGLTSEQPLVHFVPLAAVTAGAGVGVAIADALGVQGSLRSNLTGEARTLDLVDRLVEAIGTVPSLLILDNCEQVVAAVADLVALLVRRTPALNVLTTTRAPLGLAAEQVYLLPELGTADAVALFRRRAQAARPGAAVDDDVVTPLVQRLDGLPLAVELAAAKVRVMSVAEVARRLDHRFALLRGGSRDAPERHQTLIAVIDWSWNLLSEPQREALRRLAVFRAGFGLDGAEAIVGDEALERIAELVDQSLVVVEEAEPIHGGVRYRLLETVREFGLMHLVEAGDDATAEQALRAWAVGRARTARARLSSLEQIAQVTELRAEEGNLVDVLRAAVADEDVVTVVELFATLSTFWTIEGSHLKVLRFAEQIGDVLADRTIPDEIADAARVALVAVLSNRMIFAGGFHEGALATLRRLGIGAEHTDGNAHARVVLTMADHDGEDLSDLMARLGEDPDPAVARLAHYWSSHALENGGEVARAREAAERALALADPSEGPWGVASVHSQLAGLGLQAGEWAEARHHAGLALPTLVAVGAHEDAAQVRAVHALVALREGDLDEADRILDQVVAEDPTQSVFGAGVALVCGRAEVLLARGLVDEGLAGYAAGLEEIRERSRTDATLTGIGEFDGDEPWVSLPLAAALAARVRAGRAAGARADRDTLLAQARRLIGETQVWLDFPVVGCLLVGLAAWEGAHGDPEKAAELIAVSEVFSLNRMLPSLDPSWGEPLVDPVLVTTYRDRIGSPRPIELRDHAIALLDSLA
ncbi:NB-ARC domain-containing protein [Nocardioides sp.]|uniref:ATP-binding protein n=1 Tax=Nocardioides sp. TaxID=35761 RepID=UPI0026378B00|nr:NB-ARC domain-containing protein [Nocardioides sp.]